MLVLWGTAYLITEHAEKKAKQRLETLREVPVNIVYSQVSYSEILKTMNAYPSGATDFQKEQYADSTRYRYQGLWIDWTGTVANVQRNALNDNTCFCQLNVASELQHDDGLLSAIVKGIGEGIGAYQVWFEITSLDANHLSKGDRLCVRGQIEKLRGSGYVYVDLTNIQALTLVGKRSEHDVPR